MLILFARALVAVQAKLAGAMAFPLALSWARCLCLISDGCLGLFNVMKLVH